MARFSRVVIGTLFLAAACADSGSKSAASGANTPLTIAVIPEGTTHDFWKAIHAGAIQAAQELTASGDSVTIIWKGPLREDDRELQIQVVEGFRPVEEARRAEWTPESALAAAIGSA